MSKRSKRRKKKKLSTEKQTKIVAATPQELISKGDFKGAVHLIRAQISKEPTDNQRRLLRKCLIELKEYQEVTNVIQEIETKRYDDLNIAAWCFIQFKDWENAKQKVEESLKLEENPESYFWLAVVQYEECKQKQESKLFKLDDETEKSITQFLKKAVEFPRCRLGAFLWLAEFLNWGEEDTQEAVKILEQALTLYPDSEETRLALAKRLKRLDDFDRILETIDPLLIMTNPPPEAFWYAYIASEQKSDFKIALSCLNRIQLNPEHKGVGLAKLKGDILLKLGNLNEAIACYDEEVGKADLEARIIGLFSRANVRLESGDIPKAVDDVAKGVNLWLCTDIYSGILEVPEGFKIGDETFWINYLEVVDYVCNRLLQNADEVKALSNKLKGQLLYLQYYLHKNDEDDIDWNNQLLKAAELTDHPRLSIDLSSYYADNGNLPLSVDHHLRYSIWKYSTQDKSKDFSIDDGEFYFEEGQTISKQDRTQIHAIALKHLEFYHDNSSIVRDVFIPFYRSFWRDVLFEGKMFKETVEVTNIIIKSTPDSRDELWDYAYSLHEIGQLDEAQNAYTQLLKYQPDNSSALHNLSLILEKKGFLQQALELSTKAASIASNDDLIVKRSKKLKEESDQIQRQLQRQEDFLLTTPERWPKMDYYKRQLLSTLTVISDFDNWDHLLSGIEKQYLKGHWQKLLELGMIVQDKDEQWRVNKHILPLVQKERSHSVVTKIIHAEKSIVYKPIFNSKLEFTVYNLLIALFPNHLVFPNMALQAVFQYDRMKGLLDSEEFRYFIASQVDFCIVSTANYLPIIAFEVDSIYHDSPDQIERDRKKDRIFQLGGVPLLRLRAVGRPTAQAIRQEIIETVRALRTEIASTDQEAGIYVNVSLEVDFEKFGLQTTKSEVQREKT